MQLKTHRWGPEAPTSIVCIHGLTQHGRVFDELGTRLAAAGHSVVAVDLRGHGGSDPEPPWNVETHAQDLLETLDRLGVERVSCLVGHSFGGRVAATAATAAPERIERLALLDPGLQIDPARALRAAEIERRDWSFASFEGGVRAVLSSEATAAPREDLVKAFVEDDMRPGPDGRLRFSCCPSAVVVAWGEMTLPAPPVAPLPTLFVHAEVPLNDTAAQRQLYREVLGERLTEVQVPNGHNVLWESPAETIAAVAGFVDGG
jgi:lipase